MMDTDRLKGATRTTYGKVQEGYGRLADDPEAEMSGVANQAAGAGQQMFGEAKDGMREAMDRASAYAEDAYDEGRRRVAAGAQSLHAQVESNPVMSILIACAAGYLIGLAVRTSRR